MRWLTFKFFGGFLLCCSIPALPASAGPQTFPVDREFYPYYPSLIKWLQSKAPFTPPADCHDCHPAQYGQWNGSLHSLAFVDPIYQGELNKAIKAVGHEVTRQCEGCHSPAGMVTGEITRPGLSGLGPVASSGVSCDMCHSISDITHWQTPSHEPENGSFILAPGEDAGQGVLLVKRGPFKPETYCGVGLHECVESPLHLQADLCASCHQVYHYEGHFPFEATYLEWKHGPYAQRDIVCQDCHMVEINTFLQSADSLEKPVRHQYRHYFNGANYLLYSLAAAAAEKKGDQEQAAHLKKQYDMAVARLKAAAGLEISPVYQNGRLTELKVRVENLRAGHNLPTSLTNVRQMWLELRVADKSGQTVFTSGGLDQQGRLNEQTRLFNSDGMDNGFHFAIDPWIVTAFSRHDTIPSRGFRDVYYGLSLPQEAKTISVEARLRYRQADQAVAEAILAITPPDINLKETYGLEAVPSLPVVDMVVKKIDLEVKERR